MLSRYVLLLVPKIAQLISPIVQQADRLEIIILGMELNTPDRIYPFLGENAPHWRT